MSPGASGPGVPKSLEKVSKRKSLEKSFSRPFPDFLDFFDTFSGRFGVPGPEAPGDIFQTFLGFRARRAQETPVARGRVHSVSNRK